MRYVSTATSAKNEGPPKAIAFGKPRAGASCLVEVGFTALKSGGVVAGVAIVLLVGYRERIGCSLVRVETVFFDKKQR